MASRIMTTDIFATKETWQCETDSPRCVHRHQMEVYHATIREVASGEDRDEGGACYPRVFTPPALNGVNHMPAHVGCPTEIVT